MDDTFVRTEAVCLCVSAKTLISSVANDDKKQGIDWLLYGEDQKNAN